MLLKIAAKEPIRRFHGTIYSCRSYKQGCGVSLQKDVSSQRTKKCQQRAVISKRNGYWAKFP